ncbi:hypothetical protein Tco_0684508 [Tanacetum coccineum]
MSTHQDINAFRAQRIANTHDPLALRKTLKQEPFHSRSIHHILPTVQHPQPQQQLCPTPSFNTTTEHQRQDPKDIPDPITILDIALEPMSKAFQLNNTTTTNNNQRSSSNPCYSQIAQSGMNQDRHILMVDDNVENQFRQNAMQNVGHLYGNGNVVTTSAEVNGNGINGNPIRCYNYRGDSHYASNCIVKLIKRDAADLQQQLQIDQEEEAGIQSTQEEFEFMAAVDAYKETERVQVNCTLEDTLQQASISGTQFDSAPVYDSDGIQLEYTELLEPSSEPLPIQRNQNDNTVIFCGFECEQVEPAEQHLQKQEIFPVVNQVEARVQNFKIQFLKEAAKFVRDFKSLAKEADESIAKQKALELEIERLLRAVVSQDIMSIVQNPSVVDSSNLQTKLEQNAHLKTTYKNLFDSIKVTRAQTKAIIDSLQDKLHDTIYENAKLRAQLFDKVSEQKDTNKGTSVNTQFSKQSILGKPPSSSKPKLYSVTPFPKSTVIPKVGKSNALSKPVTSNSAPSSRESTVVNNERVIAPGIFRINPFKASRVDNFVPNKHVKASVRTKPITVSQPHVITKNDVNSKTNGFSPKDVKSTTRTRRPQPRNNPKSDKVPFKSKSSCLSNKLEKIEGFSYRPLL